MHVWIFATVLSTTFLIFRKLSEILTMHTDIHVKYPFSSRILMKLEFS